MSTNTKHGFSPLTTWFLPGVVVLIMTVGLWLLINLLWGSGDLGLIARFFGIESVDPRGSRSSYSLAEGANSGVHRVTQTIAADPEDQPVAAYAGDGKAASQRPATNTDGAQTQTAAAGSTAEGGNPEEEQANAQAAQQDGKDIANNSYSANGNKQSTGNPEGKQEQPLFSNPDMKPAAIFANPIDKHLPAPRKPVHAFNAELTIQSDNCLGITGKVSVPVWFRAETSAIKAASIDQLDSLVEIFNGCPNNGIAISSHIDGKLDSAGNEALSVRREQEIKYYLLSRRIPIEALTIRNAS